MSGPGRTVPIAGPTSLARASPSGVRRPVATTGPRLSGRAALVGVAVARPRRPGGGGGAARPPLAHLRRLGGGRRAGARRRALLRRARDAAPRGRREVRVRA